MTQSEVEAPASTATLVLAAQAGDREALGRLLATHLPLIYNVVGRALTWNTDVDDLVQETMVLVIGGLPGLREPDRFRSWAVTIAYREIQHYMRARRATLLRVRDAPLDVPDPSSDFAERTVTELILAEQRRELADAARWLDDADHRLLALWWQEATGELTRSELAATLTVEPQHAAVRLHRMKTRLDAARYAVRALRAQPSCAELADLIRDWNGVADPLWRKRIARHARGCRRCDVRRGGLVAPENLIRGVSAVPLPIAVAESIRLAVESATLPGLAPAVATAGETIGSSFLAHVQALLHNKTVAAAAAVTVAAGGGFAYAVHETELPRADSSFAIASPTANAPASAPAALDPAVGPAVSAEPLTRPPPIPQPWAVTGVSSADVYVAPNGSDGNDGSAARPYATLAKAVAVVRPGQTIALRGGTYRPTEKVVINASGDPQNRITLSNYRDERPVIDASLVTDGETVLHLASHWTVQGLEIKNSRSQAYVCRACQQNIFQRLSIHDNVRVGLTLRGGGTTGNQVLDSDFFRNYDPEDRGRSGVGVEVKFGSGDGNLVRGCRAFDNADSGFDVGHFDGAVRLEYNWAYGNGVNRWNATDWQAKADGFMLGGSRQTPAAAHVLRHNAAWDNVGNGFSDGGNQAGLRLENNTSFRNGAAGFNIPVAVATLRGNVAIGNEAAITAGDDAQSNGNTWNGGDWTEAMFRSTDPATAQVQRQPDGRLPTTDFLTSDTDLGATMREP